MKIHSYMFPFQRAKPATKREMSQFHTDEYVEFLSRVSPDTVENYIREQAKFNVADDCPIFDGLFEYCSISAGGSMEGAARLSRDKCDIAINWAGGLHHAKKGEASGFCYINGEQSVDRRPIGSIPFTLTPSPWLHLFRHRLGHLGAAALPSSCTLHRHRRPSRRWRRRGFLHDGQGHDLLLSQVRRVSNCPLYAAGKAWITG